MNYSLVTLEKAKAHLLMDHDADDVDIQNKIEQASQIIIDYLKLPTIPVEWDGVTGNETGTGSTEIGVPPLIQSATLLVLGELYKNREAGKIDLLSIGVTAILHRKRDPAMA